jgi:hypothetical protein
MIRAALLIGVVLIGVGAAVIVQHRLIHPASETPRKIITNRFPEGWESAPVVEYKNPEPRPSEMPPTSTNELIAVAPPAEQPRQTPRQRSDAVFNDAQIASLKKRLELTKEQEPYWQQVEASLRDVVWDPNHGIGATLEPSTLDRLKKAAARFITTLNAKQRSELQGLANIVGLRLNGQAP